ncbi:MULTISPECIES: hypothetical protein [Flavobacterium]|uniref:Uncharacterized protein n=1 Tax=Flavobacterium frigidarium TaxID=99286 RepID=A0ABV4KEV1_9FLAO|nr:hypothetical protein [Flavobacterium sp.]MDG2433234.1 hypothetical protein [Flavobacterium sp.]|tara:strand:+ start:67 stop:267 length:201 start_codon:yes stop_codon:yes gene_type:complete
MKKEFIIVAFVFGILTSCNKKVNNETESTDTTEHAHGNTDNANQVTIDSTNIMDLDKADAVHGHEH